MFFKFEFFEETWDVDEQEDEDEGDTEITLLIWLGFKLEVWTLMKAEFFERFAVVSEGCKGGGA